MERAQDKLAAGRADTDESLGAERATSNVDSHLSAMHERRELDDLIEHDRMLADSRLLKFRKNVDSTLARERLESPAPSDAVVMERDLADRDKRTEREVGDALLLRERQRSDNAVETERTKQDTARCELETRRHATDELLWTERQGADATAASLSQSMDAIAHSNVEQTRRDDVLGTVMHDLRSPLSIISMNAAIVEEFTQEPVTKKAVQRIARGAARMERLLMDLLDVARIQSGTLRIVKNPHDICALMREILQSYSPLFAERGITFIVDVPENEVVVPFDHDRVVQVFSNLLGNAMKFTPREGTVTLSLEQQPAQVEFTVQDNGPGIAPAALPLVFDRFWQIDNGDRRGLGLGLHICQQIVQGHDGRIEVESELGKGTAFRFTLPGG